MFKVGDLVEVVWQKKPGIITSIFEESDNKDKFKKSRTYYVVKYLESESTGEWLESSLRPLTALDE
jgi:hypothetical protein